MIRRDDATSSRLKRTAAQRIVEPGVIQSTAKSFRLMVGVRPRLSWRTLPRAPWGFPVLFVLFGCGARSELDVEREALFAIVTNGALQHDHHCGTVRSAEISTRNGFLEEAEVNAAHSRIASADLGSVQRCLAQVQVYNECFLKLQCSAFTLGMAEPAWLAGSWATPCGCGVDDRGASGPFAVSQLPEVLSACVDLLPVTTLSPRPGVPLGQSCVE